MSEDRLRNLMREEPLPGAAEAERRGLALIGQAYAERRPPSRLVLPRLAVALAAAALLAALFLTPAGAAVRDWIDDVFTAGVRHAEPALTDLPSGGRLLVESPRGPWVVQPDGSRRLLGRYAEATWSPRGLFVAATAGRTLNALEPDGTPRWSISASGTVRDPRWSPSGFRIAYRTGWVLRVVAADGHPDRVLARRVAPVAPVWFPLGLHLLAYVDARARLRIADADTEATLATAPAAPPKVGALSWSANGRWLLQMSRHSLRLRPVRMDKLGQDLVLAPARRLALPAGTTVRAASFAPRGEAIATLLHRPTGQGGRDEVIVLDPAGGPPLRLFAISGRLSGLTWSPDGRRLLVGWPAADQWLFLRVDGGRIQAVDDVPAAFAPGEPSPRRFPRTEGWCCALAPGGGG
jgi:dipeptidyl aminopeptidase/acylaminoacyl peptidase